MVEIAKILVAGQYIGELARSIKAIAGEQHPQVLYRWSHAGVVEVDKVGAGIGPQQIAAVAVAVQSDRREVSRLCEACLYPLECVIDDRGVGRQQVGRYPVAREQKVAGAGAEGFDVQGWAVLEGDDGTDGVDPPEEPAQPLQDR